MKNYLYVSNKEPSSDVVSIAMEYEVNLVTMVWPDELKNRQIDPSDINKAIYTSGIDIDGVIVTDIDHGLILRPWFNIGVITEGTRYSSNGEVNFYPRDGNVLKETRVLFHQTRTFTRMVHVFPDGEHRFRESSNSSATTWGRYRPYAERMLKRWLEDMGK